MMRNIKIFYTIIVFHLLTVSCFEDKGNYDYIDIERNKIGIEYQSSNVEAYKGEPIIFTPILKFYNSVQNDTNIYRWSYHFNDLGCVYNGRNMNVVIKDALVGKVYNGVAIAVDTTTGMSYTSNISFEYKSRYGTGWLILSDDGGKSRLNLVREQNGVWFKDDDIYKMLNNKDLGTSPKHLILNKTGRSEVRIVQSGPEGSLVLDPVTYAEITSFAEEFVEGRLPDHFEPKFMCASLNLALLQGENGEVYTKVFNSRPNTYSYDYFVSEPVKFENKALHVKYALTNYPVGRFNNLLLYDDIIKSFFILNGAAYYSANKLDRIIVPYSWPDQSVLMPNNLTGYENRYSQLKNTSNWECDCFSVLKNIASGQYSIYVFTYDTRKSILKAVTFKGFTASSFMDDDTFFHSLRTRPYLFFTAGSKLYIYDVNTDKFWIYKDFNTSKIVSIESNYAQSDNSVAVGLDNGELYLLDISEETLISGVAQVIFNTKITGKIIDVIYK